MKNIANRNKEIDKVIYDGYKLLDNREVTADAVINCLNILSVSEKIIIMSNLQDIITKLHENNRIFIEALLKDI